MTKTFKDIDFDKLESIYRIIVTHSKDSNKVNLNDEIYILTDSELDRLLEAYYGDSYDYF